MLCGDLSHFVVRFLSVRRPLVPAHNELWFPLAGFPSSPCTRARSGRVPIPPRVRLRAGRREALGNAPQASPRPHLQACGAARGQGPCRGVGWCPADAVAGGGVPGASGTCFPQQINPQGPMMPVVFSSSLNTRTEMNTHCVTRQPRC